MDNNHFYVTDIQCNEYKKKLTDRIFKILGLKEINCPTIDVYIDSLIYELHGVGKVYSFDQSFVQLVGILHMIKDEHSHKIYKQKIFQCTNELIPNLFRKDMD